MAGKQVISGFLADLRSGHVSSSCVILILSCPVVIIIVRITYIIVICSNQPYHQINLIIMYSADKRPTITSSAAQSNHPSQTKGIAASTFSTPSIQTRVHVTSSSQPMTQTRTIEAEEGAKVDPKWSDVRVVHPAWEGWGIGPGGKSKL